MSQKIKVTHIPKDILEQIQSLSQDTKVETLPSFVTKRVTVVEESSSESESEDEENQQLSTIGSPFCMFQLPTCQLPVYTSTLSQPSIQSLVELQKHKKWAFFLFSSGHFAGAIYDCQSESLLISKTFHRYTTRRKQGGAQSSNDKGKGKAKSAGAQIRRYNELQLTQEIQQLLSDWNSSLDECDVIFCRIPKQHRQWIRDLKNVKSIPFITKRPTLDETTRCFQKLLYTETIPLAESKKTVVKQATMKQVTIDDLIDAIKSTRLDYVKENLTDEMIKTSHETGPLLYHAASSPSLFEYLLERGADPSQSGPLGVPYVVAIPTVRKTLQQWLYHNNGDFKACQVPEWSPELEESKKEKEKLKKKLKKLKQKLQKQEQQNLLETASKEAILEHPKVTTEHHSTKLSIMDKQTLGMTAQQKLSFEREKRAMAAESRIRSQKGNCAECNKKLNGPTFDKGIYRYCTMDCLKVIKIN